MSFPVSFNMMPGLQGVSGLAGLSAPGGGANLASLMGGVNSPAFSSIGGGTPGLDAASLHNMGVSNSSLMLMAQINMMMASVLSGIGMLMQQIMASVQQRQQAGGSLSAAGNGGGFNPAPGNGGSATNGAGVIGNSSVAGGGAAPAPTGLQETGNPGPASNMGFISPLPQGSYGLGDGINARRSYGAHGGQDMGAPMGTPVMAAKDGVVTRIDFDPGGYGNWVEIQHPDGTRTRYAHLSSFGGFQKGQSVRQGNIIGKVGSTGNSTGPHLHFEVIAPDGRKYEPRQVAAL